MVGSFMKRWMVERRDGKDGRMVYTKTDGGKEGREGW